MDPFQILVDIDHHCKTHSIKIPREIITERDWLGIGFKCSNFNFVCPMSTVAEILKWPTITSIPAAQPWFRGTTNLRGRLLPISDLEGFISGIPHHESPTSRILVIRFNQSLFGFAVAQVSGIERFFGAEIKSANNVTNLTPYLPYVSGAFERDNKPWVILNFEGLIESTGFYHLLKPKTEVA